MFDPLLPITGNERGSRKTLEFNLTPIDQLITFNLLQSGLPMSPDATEPGYLQSELDCKGKTVK